MTTLARTRNHVSRIYSGPRLATTVLLLGIVGMMMYNARDPGNWKWLEELTPEPEPAMATNQPLQQTEKKSDSKIRYDATSKDYDPDTVKIDDPTNANFHWDKDPEEKDLLAHDYQVVIDGTMALLPEEMHNYSRLLRWVKTRAFQDLAKSSNTNWTFNDLQQEPKKHRAELLKLPLNVVRIFPIHDYTDPKTKETRTIYEVWGWSAKKSGNFLYVAIVPELPDGMPTGVDLKEKVTLVGYFYKLQGYLEAKANPRSVPFKAPLIIGRLAWEPNTRDSVPPPPEMEWKKEWTWWLLSTVFVAYIGFRWWLRSSRKQPSTIERQLETQDTALIGDWLENPETSGLNEPESESDQASQQPPQIDPNFTNKQ